MVFYIRPLINRIAYRLRVEQVMIDSVKEQYRISGRNKSIVLQSNRPLFRNKGIKHRKPNWKLVEGSVHYHSDMEPIIAEIMKIID